MQAAQKHMDELTRQIYRLYHSNVNINKAIKRLRRQNISADLVKSIYDRVSKDAENLMTDRFHYYTMRDGISDYFRVLGCWTNRYLIGYDIESGDSNSREIQIIDLFNDKSIKVSFEKDGRLLVEIVSLKDGFGLLEEDGDGSCFISLIFMDISRHTLQKLHTVEYPKTNIDIYVNKADPTTFLLDDNESSRICKIVDQTIIIDERLENKFTSCFYNKCVYTLEFYYRDDQDRDLTPRISIYNVEEKTENQFDLELPAGYTLKLEYVECVRDNLFIELKCENNSRVIACVNVQTRQLNILDFSSKLTIRSIDWFEEGSLVVQTQKNELTQHYFYKIPFGNPELLENTAWLNLVKSMKKCKKIKDPYGAARKYLPYNSTINCPFDKLFM